MVERRVGVYGSLEVEGSQLAEPLSRSSTHSLYPYPPQPWGRTSLSTRFCGEEERSSV